MARSGDGEGSPPAIALDMVHMHLGLPPPLPPRPSTSTAKSVFEVAREEMEAGVGKTMLAQKGEYNKLRFLPSPRDLTDFSVPKLNLRKALARASRPLSLPLCVWKQVKAVGWFCWLLWPQILLGIGVVILAAHVEVWDRELVRDFKSNHDSLVQILGFLIGFRINGAYNKYCEGRALFDKVLTNLQSTILEVYTSLAKDVSGPEASTAEVYLHQDIRRRVNALLALVRQAVRERRDGFLPHTEMEGVPFNAQTYVCDPVRPRLWDLLTENEVARYAPIDPESRVPVAIGELRAILQLSSSKLQHSGAFLNTCHNHLEAVHDATRDMLRLRNSQVPRPYLYILHITTFFVVYSTPFFYGNCRDLVFMGMMLVVFCYFGLLELSLQLEDPFGFDFFDLALEQYCQELHDRTQAIAEALGGDKHSFMPPQVGKQAVTQ